MGIGLLILLAVLQAATEFIPVSSSGHLFLVRELFEVVDTLTVDVVLHFATLVSLVWVFRDKIKLILLNLSENKNLVIALIVGSIPAAVFGFWLDEFIEASLRNSLVVITMLILVGIVMIFEEKLFTGNKEYQEVEASNAFIIGVFQMLALVPGVSRSGITMIGSKLVGFNNRAAAEFSFLLGIPIIFGATFKILVVDRALDNFDGSVVDLGIASVIAALTGVVVLKFLIEFVAKHGLKVFGWYRIILAVSLIFILGV